MTFPERNRGILGYVITVDFTADTPGLLCHLRKPRSTNVNKEIIRKNNDK